MTFVCKKNMLFFKSKTVLLILLTVAISLLIPRVGNSGDFLSRFLWAEDGNIFINQAHSLGISSLWTPYAGYLHAYPRLVAYFANYFELINRPIILFYGWVIAYIFMCLVLINGAIKSGLNFTSTLFLICLVSLQPNNGENFFNITNSQWLIGNSLVILIILSTNNSLKPSILNPFLLFLSGITGPFSILMIPVIFIKAFILKDLKKCFWVYGIVIFTGAIQLYTLISSDRISKQDAIAPVWSWIVSFIKLVLFGAVNSFTITAAMIFWLILIYLAKKNINLKNITSLNVIAPILLIISAVIFLGASLFAFKENPLTITSPGSGIRYTWIPYSLFFFAAVLISSSNRFLQRILFITALLICIKQFKSLEPTNLNFESFVNFSKYKNVIIPLNPQSPPAYPGWNININSLATDQSAKLQKISVKNFNVLPFSHEVKALKSGFKKEFYDNSYMLTFNEKFSCGKNLDIAIEVDINRSNGGWIRLFYDKNNKFKDSKTIRRWYPSGLVKAQFAFKNELVDNYVRFQLDGTPYKNLDIKSINIYCLP